jgi:hypothetical protein
MGKRGIMFDCEHCGKKTAIGFHEWLELTKVMMTFSNLEKSQQELILLLMDGIKYRNERPTP